LNSGMEPGWGEPLDTGCTFVKMWDTVHNGMSWATLVSRERGPSGIGPTCSGVV
jgi:hypothetical protein